MTVSQPTWKYILVWILASILGNIFAKGLSSAIYSGMRSTNDVLEVMFFAIPAEVAAVGLVIIIVYSVFSSLDMSSVFPWIVGLSIFGLLLDMLMLSSFDFAFGWVFAYQAACIAAMLFGIRAFFKSRGRLV